jgi:beta-glucosidase-like glycosyl hydrolase/CubicO group peptidase (beta-lactamase class C family)
MKNLLLSFISCIFFITSQAQFKNLTDRSPAAKASGDGAQAGNLSENNWVDSVFNSLNNEEKIAQLIVIRAHSNLGADHVAQVTDLIKKYDVGALCFFQGGPVRQANLTNYYQSISKTPLLITIDAEYGLGMRLDSITKFPYQLTLGALNDPLLIYEMGRAVGEQCKRIGVQVNFAPVVDINNDPDNPVIGFRSFGEDKDKVTKFGLAYMKGMQDVGIMACAKHFPGHGDVSVDSHLDLPVINKSIEQLDSLELKPFKALFDAGVGSVMIAHLYIPAIDSTPNMATSLSKNNITGLLRNSMGYNGLAFTDALEMKGVAKYWPGGEIAAQALIAGNDMLCLPESVPGAIAAVEKAIDGKKLSWDDINAKLKKVLHAKYHLGLYKWKPVDTTNLVKDLNARTDEIRYRVARQTITIVKNKVANYIASPKIACVSIGASSQNFFVNTLHERRNADVFSFSYKDGTKKSDSILRAIRSGSYDEIVVSVNGYSLRPANNYGISKSAIDLFDQLQKFNTKNYVFGNVLAIENFFSASQLIACYQDDDVTQYTAADQYAGLINAKGSLPVSIGEFRYGYSAYSPPNYAFDKFYRVDSIVSDAIDKGTFPGCVVLAAKDGKIIYQKAYGHYQFNPSSPQTKPESIFDLASLTKISATTVSIMKLYDQGKINLNGRLANYLPSTKGTNKAKLRISDILLHQAGLEPDVLFYKYVRDSVTHQPNPAIISAEKPGFTIRVAENLYLRNDWLDTAFQLVLDSKLGPSNKYVYSDLDFIFLGKVVEAVSKMSLDQYARKTFYKPLGMKTTGFKPLEMFKHDQIVPTELDTLFRWQLLWGDVHDYSASVLGQVAGHAGLFSDAGDLFRLYQMLLNEGTSKDQRYLKSKTIKLFTSYHSSISRRGYGFDKPEKDNATRNQPYPAAKVSPETFGHTGWTGTCVWVDPKYKIIYIFLSNRVQSQVNNGKLSELSIRSKIQDAIYKALGI